TGDSKELKPKVTVPKSWNASSSDADAMSTLLENKGLAVRIARDVNNLDPRGTFNVTKEEGWNSDGEQTADARFQAAEFSKSNENLLLILIPEQGKTTLVIYATCKQEFNGDQRLNISSIVQQVLPVE